MKTPANAEPLSLQALGRWLHGIGPLPNFISGASSELQEALVEHDVICLANARLEAEHPAHQGSAIDAPGMAEVQAFVRREARALSLNSICMEAETRRVLSALAQVGSPGLLLKGNALAHWAYAQPHLRACSDLDILLPSRALAERLAGALCESGYTRASTSGALVAFELMCSRQVTPDWAVEIDVHWRLVNSVLFADRFSFDELMAESVDMPSLGSNACGLGPVHAMLHAAMHRASNITIGVGDRLKWLYDFVVLTQRFSEADWSLAVELAVERQLAGVTLSALVATGETFGMAMPPSVLERLREAARLEPLDATRLADWRYMQAQTLRALPGLFPKASWLWQRLFPSRDYMTYLYGEQGSFAGLLRERARRAWRKWQG